MAFVSHRRRGDDRWLEWKVRLFSVAAMLGLAGIYFEERRLTGAAILVLTGGILLRLIPRRDRGDDDHGDDDQDEIEPPSEDERRSGRTEL